jgi:glycerol kinase
MDKFKYIWSLDLSTTNVGAALWNNKGELVELKHLELKAPSSVPISERDIFKANTFKEYVIAFKNRIKEEFNGEISHVIIEEPLGGSNNSKTVATLYEFNGICRYIIYTIFGVYPIKISVHDSRKLFFPEYVKQVKKKGEIVEVLSFPDEWKDNKKYCIWLKVSKLYPNIEWVYKKDGVTPKDMCYDMSDSIVVGIGGLKQLNILK